MTAGRLLLIATLLVTVTPALAHRLDGYLQASVIALESRDLTITLSMTPGHDIADRHRRLGPVARHRRERHPHDDRQRRHAVRSRSERRNRGDGHPAFSTDTPQAGSPRSRISKRPSFGNREKAGEHKGAAPLHEHRFARPEPGSKLLPSPNQRGAIKRGANMVRVRSNPGFVCQADRATCRWRHIRARRRMPSENPV